MTHYGWIWLAIAVVAILATILTKKIQYATFIPGAILAMVMDIIDCNSSLEFNIISQLIAFVAAISIVFVAITVILTIVMRKKKSGSVIDSVVGAKCTVVEVIDEYAGSGQVRVNGQEWAARLVNEDDVAQIGETLKIVAIEGPKLICKK